MGQWGHALVIKCLPIGVDAVSPVLEKCRGDVLGKPEGQTIEIKYFSFLDLAFLQLLDHLPEEVVFAKFIVGPDLEFFHGMGARQR